MRIVNPEFRKVVQSGANGEGEMSDKLSENMGCARVLDAKTGAVLVSPQLLDQWIARVATLEAQLATARERCAVLQWLWKGETGDTEYELDADWEGLVDEWRKTEGGRIP